MSLSRPVLYLAGFAAACALLLAGALALGGPGTPQPMASINDPFKTVDFSGMPPLRRYTAQDGASLAYRHYPPQGASAPGSVVLVHGSAASSESMHVLARAL